MRANQYLAALAAAALLLTACGKMDDSSSSSSSGSKPGSGSASGQKDDAWKTGLAIRTETEAGDKSGKIHSIAAAVLLDEDGRIVQVVLDELEGKISTTEAGAVTVAEDLRTKRQKGDEDYPLSAVSSIGKSWAEQADAFGEYLMGMTADEVSRLSTDADGYAKDADLLSGCTIKVDGYREAVEAACAQAQAMGAAEGDSLALGIETTDASTTLQATSDKNAMPQLDVTAAALTVNGSGRVTSAVCDMAEPSLKVDAKGMVSGEGEVKSKHVLGDDYGMRKASALGKEWYEHSDGFAGYLKGKTAEEIEKIPDDGSDADLASMCTIDITDLQKAALRAMDTLRS